MIGAYGATARFSPAGWRRQLTLVTHAPAALALVPLSTVAGTGLDLEFPVRALELGAAASAPSAGARVNAAVPPAEALGAVSYVASQGTTVPNPTPPDLVLAPLAYDPRAGASVHVRGGRTTYLVSTVAAWATAAGPAARVPRHLRTSSPATAVKAGVTLRLPVSDIVLSPPSYELGARRKAVRGQFLIYN